MSKINPAANIRMRMLNPSQKAILRRIDENASSFRSFTRGDEFYGKIIKGTEKKSLLSIKAEPLVGSQVVGNRSLVCLADRTGRNISEDLFIRDVRSSGAGIILFEVEKPENYLGQRLLSYPTSLITTNTFFTPWRREIRARYDDEAITVYQAFRKDIAEQAASLQKFGDKFSPNRMSWIKPSFLWMMQRSEWGERKGQESILTIKLLRSSFETLLCAATLSNPVIGIYFRSENEFASEAIKLKNRVQWDPEKNMAGRRMAEKSLQLGISPENHHVYHNGIIEIKDITALAREVRRLWKTGQEYEALLPPEYLYPTPEELLRPLEMRQFFADDMTRLIAD